MALSCALAIFVIYRWNQVGAYPTGLDGGNWLGIGRNILGGDVYSPNGGVYPPLVPILLHLASLVVAPPLAVKVTAVVSGLAVPAAVFVAGRAEAGWWAALLAAALVAFARPITEPMAFGGYPQNLGVAWCLLATWAVAKLLSEPGRGVLTWAAIFFVLAGLSHHMYFIFTVTAAVVVAALWVAAVRPPKAAAVRRAKLLAAPLAAGLAVFAPTYAWLAAAGYDPVVNASGTSLGAAVEYGFRGAVRPWVVLWVVASVGAAIRLAASARPQSDPPSPLLLAAGGMLALASGAFLLTAEPRLLPGVAVSAPLVLGVLASEAVRRAGNVPLTAAAAAFPASLLVALAPSFDAVIEDDLAFYRMLDGDFVEAAAWSDEHPPHGAVAVAADRRNWPVGWWWRGLGGERVLVGGNAKWLAFERERADAALVSSLLRAHTSAEAAHIARSGGIARLAAFREEWISWDDWLGEAAPEVTLVFANETFVIVDFGPAPAPP